MCVIIVCKNKLPSWDDVKRCEAANGDGGGISWAEDGQVRWKKGITGEEVYSIMCREKKNLVAHFRIATVGDKSKKLTHPFPIDKGVGLDLTGKAASVLHHNGHWANWEEWCMKMVIDKNAYFPHGEWSDSRALAWLIHNTNPSFLRFLRGNKVAIHTPKHTFRYGEWEEVDGVFYSNKSWSYNTVYNQYDYDAWYKKGKTGVRPEYPLYGNALDESLSKLAYVPVKHRLADEGE